jgi:LCP family protein required for cell wall assembly
MSMKVYRSGDFGDRQRRDDHDYGHDRGPKKRRPRYGIRRMFFVVLFLICAALLYLLVPVGSQRAVLLGSDARTEETSRSDTIVVAKASGGFLAVPRDTLVEIPDVGEDKINAAYASGGPELTVESLENLTGLRINNYVVVDFGGVQEIVDSLGGITINVEQPIYYGMDGRQVSIPAGTQTLSGFEALGYVRYRGDPTADIGRIGRQQQFIHALAAEAASPSRLPRLPAVAAAVWRNVETNMNPVEAARFALQTMLYGDGEAEIYPGTPQYIDGISYWVPDRAAGEEVVSQTVE